MNSKNDKFKVNEQVLYLDKSLNGLFLTQDTKKKEKTLKWNKSLTNKSSKIVNSVSEPLDVSNYKIKKKDIMHDFIESDSLNKTQFSLIASSESSTGTSINKLTLNKNEKENNVEITINSNNSDLAGTNLYDSLVCRQTFYLERQNSIEEVPNETNNESEIEGIKTVDEMGFVLQEGTGEGKEEEYIWDDSIRIVSFISQGAQAKVFLGLVLETESFVAVKRYLINYNEVELNRILEECEIIKTIEHPNIIKYFDIEYVIIEQDIGQTYNYEKVQNKMMTRIDLIMEYLEGLSLKDYVTRHVKENKCGLPLDVVKYIARNILEGLKHLHENKIIHRDLKVSVIMYFIQFLLARKCDCK